MKLRLSPALAKTAPTGLLYVPVYRLPRWHGPTGKLWRSNLTGQQSAEELKDLLSKVPLFHNAPDRALEIATSAVRKRDYEPGATVFQEGDKGEALYIIAKGLVKLSKVDLGGHEKTSDD